MKYELFAIVLKEARTRALATLVSISDETHIPISTYKTYEFGTCLPRPSNMQKLLDFFEKKKIDTRTLYNVYVDYKAK